MERIRILTAGLTYDEFSEDLTRQEAVIRNLEIIGEASKSVPHEIRSKHPEVDWARIGGLRDVLIHRYFGIDLEIIWDILQSKLPNLEVQIKKVLAESD